MLVLLILIVVVGLWVVTAYNGLISLKNQTVNAFKQIDVQLKRRHDLIPNLVNAVKGAMDFERSTLEAVIQARNQAVKVNASGPEGIKQISQAENALSGALSRLLVTVERYPDLKQIDVQLKRRHDLIPNLVNAVKGAMDFERSTLEAVIQARNQAVKVNASGPEGIKQISQAENALSGALSRLLVTVERYPDLK